MEMYGGELSPDLKSGTFGSGNVSVKISAKGSATSSLSPEQARDLVSEIQRQLLAQAQRNRKRNGGGDDDSAG
jgi:hypothetical protein